MLIAVLQILQRKGRMLENKRDAEVQLISKLRREGRR